MTVREIIQKLENEKKQIKERYENEINTLKEENKKLAIINEKLTADVKNMMEYFLKRKEIEEVIDEKSDNVVELGDSDPVTPEQETLFDSDPTPIVNTPAKPKRSRKKKVEPVEEPEKNA